MQDKPLRALTKTASATPRRRRDCASRSLLIHYPAAIEVTDSTSSYSLHPESAARRINSTPTLQSGEHSKSPSRRGTRAKGEIGDRGSKIRKCPPSSFADSRHPVIDISSLDYKAYRHRLIDATLRKQYDNFQPPGDVVLNSLHLNSADSVIGVRLNDRYDHSLFDFVEEYYDVARATGRKNVDCLHPLDHFLPRGERRPRTSEKETETTPDNGVDRENSRDHFSENVGGNPPESPSVDDNGNPCVRAPPDDVFDRDPNSEVPLLRRPISRSRKRTAKTTSGRDAEDDCPPRAIERSSIDGRSDRPASVGDASTIFSLSRAATSPGDREATGSPRPGSGSRESRKKLEDYPPAVLPLSSERRADGVADGRSNFISVSSSEIASIRSDSSKCRDEEVSCRSRESSISPRNHASSRPPWLSGSRGTSFNRKYGRNITETSAAWIARPMSARGSAPPWQKLLVSSRGRSKESSPASTTRNPRVFPERRAASFVASRGKEFIGMTIERQEREGNSARRPRVRRSKSKDVVAVKHNEEGRTLKTTDYSPCGKKIFARRTVTPTSPDSVALSSPGRTPTCPTKRSPRAAFSADAPATAGKTWATKKPELITSRRDAEGARGRPVSGRSSPARRRQENQAKLNRDGRRQLRSTENPSKGASLSPQIELSAEVLNPANDDTDKSAIPDGGENLTELTSRIDPRGNAGTAGSDGPRAESAKTATRSDVRSNSSNDVTRSRMPKSAIIRDLRARPASANNLHEGHRPGAASPPPALPDANSETESGLNGAKLNTRSNGAADGMRYDESPSARASPPAPSRDCGNVAVAEETRQGDTAGRRGEELQLPRHDSKIGLAMNSALKRYIKMLKQGLLNHGDKDGGVALASLSLSDAISILSEQRTPLSPEEIQELQAVLDRIERNPELLCKLSCPSIESVV